MNKGLRISIYILLAAALLAVGAYLIWPGMNLGLTAGLTPDQVVMGYYSWYLDYIRSDTEGEFHNPLVELAYQDSRLLTKDFISRIDRIVEGDQGIHYDPFLCAQDVPEAIDVISSFQSDDVATVVVKSSFYGHIYTVDLEKRWGQWKISEVNCGTTPVGVASAFYAWYLDYIGDPEEGDINNPLVDRAFRSSRQLSKRFIGSVDEALAEMSGGGFDPFLRAQDIPDSFWVEAGEDENTALVYLRFGADSIKILRVQVALEDGRLVIDQVQDYSRNSEGITSEDY
jgi:hypothetical protein